MRMNVHAIELIGLEYRFAEEEAYGSSRALTAKRQAALVTVRTDDGIEGIGEAHAPLGPVRASLELIKPHFLGTDIHDREVVWSKIVNRLYHFGDENALVAAYSGLNLAMLDALGKSLGLPVCKLLGGMARSELIAYASDGYITRRPQQDLQRQLESISRLGFPGAKIKIGLGPAVDEARVAAARAILGDRIALMVDANGNYTEELALESMRRIAPYGIAWFEEPLPPQDFRGYAHLRTRAPMPVAAGEAHNSVYAFHRLLQGGCVDIAQPNVCSCGGLDQARRIADLCRLYNVRVIPNVWDSAVGLAAAVQFVAALPPYPESDHAPVPYWFEYDLSANPLRDELLVDAIVPKDGVIRVSEAPGLGIALNPETLRRYAVSAPT